MPSEYGVKRDGWVNSHTLFAMEHLHDLAYTINLILSLTEKSKLNYYHLNNRGTAMLSVFIYGKTSLLVEMNEHIY
jgi:hypothetical protein